MTMQFDVAAMADRKAVKYYCTEHEQNQYVHKIEVESQHNK